MNALHLELTNAEATDEHKYSYTLICDRAKVQQSWESDMLSIASLVCLQI